MLVQVTAQVHHQLHWQRELVRRQCQNVVQLDAKGTRRFWGCWRIWKACRSQLSTFSGHSLISTRYIMLQEGFILLISCACHFFYRYAVLHCSNTNSVGLSYVSALQFRSSDCKQVLLRIPLRLISIRYTAQNVVTYAPNGYEMIVILFAWVPKQLMNVSPQANWYSVELISHLNR